MEEMHRAKHRVSMPSPASHPPGISSCSPTQLSKPSILFHVEASWHRNDWLHHWPSVTDVNLYSISPPSFGLPIISPSYRGFSEVTSLTKPRCGWKGIVKNKKILISPLWLCSPFRNKGQETKYHSKRYFHWSYVSELLSFEPETEQKQNIHFFALLHFIHLLVLFLLGIYLYRILVSFF